MNVDHPEASSSTATARRPHHLATVVFDALTLPREGYIKLIQPDGVIHKLTQRLMEKYGGEDHVRLSIVITTPPSFICTKATAAFRQGFSRPSTFLGSLPKLASRFPLDGAGNVNDISWPRFNEGKKVDFVGEKKRSRISEERLMDGLIGGLELLDSTFHAQSPASPPSSWASLTPPSGYPIIDGVYLPPQQPPAKSPSQHKLLVVVSGSLSDNFSDANERPMFGTGWDGLWDETDWSKLAEGSKLRGVRCSVVLYDEHQGESMLKRRLKDFVYATCEESTDDPWFNSPSEVEILLSGFAVDPTSVPSPPGIQTHVPAADNIVTPSSALDATTPGGSTQKQQLLMQQQALRLLQNQATRSQDGKNGPISPAVIQNIMNAAKNGHIDLNNPALQQFKHLIMLQQQQRQQQGAQQAANLVPGANVEQMIAAAVKQQQAAQQQPGYGQGHNGSGMGNGAVATPLQPQALQQQAQQYQQQQLQQQQQQQQSTPQQQQAIQQNQPPQNHTPQQRTNSSQQQIQQQQQFQQQQQQMQQVQQQQQQQQQQQVQQPPQHQNQQADQNKPPRLWSGDLVWMIPNNGQSSKFKLTVDSYPFNAQSPADFQLNHWTPELKVAHMRQMNIAELQKYARENRTPIVLFGPSSLPNVDAGNNGRYQTFVTSLHSKGNMAIVPLMPTSQPDRGILLFTMGGSNQPGGGQPRLMGAICIAAPLPTSLRTQTPQAPQIPSQQQVAVQQQQQQPPPPPQQQIPGLPPGMTPQQIQQLNAISQSMSVPATQQANFQQFQQFQNQQQQQQQPPPQLQQQQVNFQQIQQQLQSGHQQPALPPTQAQPQLQAQYQQLHQPSQFQYGQPSRPQPPQQQPVQQPQQMQPQQVNQNFNQMQQMQQPQQQLQRQLQQQQQQQQQLHPQAQIQQQPGIPQQQSQQQQQQQQSGFIDARGAQMIRDMAVNYGINLPPNFDPNGVGPEKLQAIMRVIRQAEAQHKAAQVAASGMQQQQVQQQVQQQQQQAQQRQMQGMMGIPPSLGGMPGQQVQPQQIQQAQQNFQGIPQGVPRQQQQQQPMQISQQEQRPFGGVNHMGLPMSMQQAGLQMGYGNAINMMQGQGQGQGQGQVQGQNQGQQYMQQ